MTTEYHLHVGGKPLGEVEIPTHVLETRFVLSDLELSRLRDLVRYRALPWYRRAWLTLTGKAPR